MNKNLSCDQEIITFVHFSISISDSSTDLGFIFRHKKYVLFGVKIFFYSRIV